MEPISNNKLSETTALGIIVASPEELYDEEMTQAEQEGSEFEESQGTEAEYSLLASHIIKSFDSNKNAKKDSGIEEEIFASLRDYNGTYNPEDLSKIAAEGGSSIYMSLTATKSRAAMSWIRDILLSANQDAFSIQATPIPTLPEDMNATLEEAFTTEFLTKAKSPVPGGAPAIQSPKDAQDAITSINKDKRDIKDAIINELNLEAAEQMSLMERKIKDDLKEGGWDQALSDFIEDFCIFPTAFMKGPVVTKKQKLRWETGRPVVEEVYCFLNKRVSPMDIYPSATATTIQEGNLIEHLRLSAEELAGLRGAIGYHTDAIDKLLEENINGLAWVDTGIEQDKAEEENKGNTDKADEGIFHALHFWGTAKASDVEGWGLDIDTSDPNRYYEIEAILVGTEIIKCKLNTDPLKRRPYYKASYQNIPGSFWGRSLPSLMRDIQRMCNACARALANNMGLAAGPQIELYIDRLADAGDIEDIKPLKIWQVTNDPTGASGRAINFFQVPSIANELLGVYDKFEQKADDATGIPRYSYGNDKVGGAAQALANYEKVSTPYGPVYISDLVVGDIINNTYGSTSKVTGVYPQGERDVFRVHFSNKETVDCDLNHRWSVATNKLFSTKTLEQILDEGIYYDTKGGKKLKFKLPEVSCVFFEEKKVPVDPYTMGAWLGDGSKGKGIICGADVEVFENIPYQKSKQAGSNIHYNCLGLITDLKKTEVWDKGSHTKFIPDDYLQNSEGVRLELLRGLMDTDGCCTKDGKLIFTTSSKKLRDSFIRLVRSLGGFCKGYSRNKKEGYKDSFKIVFQYNDVSTPIFKIKRKENLRRVKTKDHTLFISKVRYVGKSPATCITVDSNDSLFLVDNFIPTHNTASGLSMLLESATKSIKDAIRHIDSGLIIPRVEYQFYWNLIKNVINYTGDVNVVAHGSDTLTMRGAQQAKRQEFLQITANQADQDLMGPEGRAELIRQLAKDLNLTTEIVPSRLEIRKKVEEAKAAAEQAASQGTAENQASLQATQLQIDGQKEMHAQTLQLRQAELQQKSALEQQRNQIETERVAATREATQARAMTASNTAQVAAQAKRETARTSAAVSLMGKSE